MIGALGAALSFADRGWPVAPWATSGSRKYPLTEHGHNDATNDRSIIAEWWRRWPDAVPSIATGERSGIVALDIDLRPAGSGFDTLEMMGVATHPASPTAYTPQGGCAVLFRWPGHFVKTVAGRLGTYLDIRGDGGSLLLPPGPGRWWDPHLGPETPLAPMPEWMVIPEPAAPPIAPAPVMSQPLGRYAEAALDGAVKAIITAPDGQQRKTLNTETYSIARLVAGGVIPAGLAVESLRWAAQQMRSHDPRRPWRRDDLDKAVRLAFADGLARPRQPERVA
ncbi:MAG TPA: bifunctional DNA primase/polymerase [Stellaceae bacterium]|nr:bifunctional DNA primase/polymerase [Stellaceae bacterium]